MSDTLNDGESSQSTIQLNIKTLESQMHSFYVDKKISVAALKDKIEQELRIPVSQQRLIFRGRVLKDDHYISDYQVENGHTLHLVTRQSTQSQSQSQPDGSSEDTNDSNRSNEANGIPSNNRLGQIAHSILLGTINVGDVGLGDGLASDATRVIGAVLNSFGLGGIASGGVSGAAQPSNTTSQGNEMEGSRTSVGGHGQGTNQSQSGSVNSVRSFQSQPQVLQIPLNAAGPIPSRSVHPIPDSLTTLLEFMTRLEQSIAQNGYQQSGSAVNQNQETSNAERSPDFHGVPNAEALANVLNHAERLLRGPVTSTLSHVAGRLENEGSSSDINVRSQIQRESVHLGLVMQHLGALCLELGRTILTLRMGQQPAQSAVNSGPAVYISSDRPNPIMVQPFPWQTSSLFGGPIGALNSGNSNPSIVGNIPRHVNIHIHAGTAVEPVVSSLGTSANNGENLTADRRNGIGSGGSASVTVLPIRSFMATQPVSTASVQQNLSAESLSSSIGDLNLLGRGVGGSRPAGNQIPEGSSSMNSSESDPEATRTVEKINSYLRNLMDNRGNQSQPDLAASVPQDEINPNLRTLVGNQSEIDSTQNVDFNVQSVEVQSGSDVFVSQNSSNATSPPNSDKEQILGSTSHQPRNLESSEMHSFSNPATAQSENFNGTKNDLSKQVLEVEAIPNEACSRQDSSKSAPLGLGLGNLQRKMRAKTTKTVGGSSSNESQMAIPQPSSSSGLVDFSGSQMRETAMSDSSSGGPNPMSEALQNPAFDGLLTGISEQVGVGSPNILRSMLMQLSQNPQIMNTVGQIAQQVDSRNIEGMLSGQPGSLDFSSIMQQMMPVVSRVLTSSPLPNHGNQNQSTQRSFSSHEIHQNESDVQEVIEKIEISNSPADIFQAVADAAANEIETSQDLIPLLTSDEDLISAYMAVLRQDVQEHNSGNS